MNRRHFLALAPALAAAPVLASAPVGSSVCVFTKGLESLPWPELADRLAALGVTGVEAPVRKGGHIEPDAVADKLPELVSILRQRGIAVTLITTGITTADASAALTLRTAARLGIPRYRLGYYRYQTDRPVRPQVAGFGGHLRDLAALNRETGIRGVYQNHAGDTTFGSALWDLDAALGDISPADLGVAWDLRHAAVEGGTNWPLGYRLLRPRIDTVYVKDFSWQGRTLTNVPLGQGICDFPRLFRLLRGSAFTGPVSLHVEYIEPRAPDAVEKQLEGLRMDLHTLETLRRS